MNKQSQDGGPREQVNPGKPIGRPDSRQLQEYEAELNRLGTRDIIPAFIVELDQGTRTLTVTAFYNKNPRFDELRQRFAGSVISESRRHFGLLQLPHSSGHWAAFTTGGRRDASAVYFQDKRTLVREPTVTISNSALRVCCVPGDAVKLTLFS